MASDDAGYPGPSPVSDHSLFASVLVTVRRRALDKLDLLKF